MAHDRDFEDLGELLARIFASGDTRAAHRARERHLRSMNNPGGGYRLRDLFLDASRPRLDDEQLLEALNASAGVAQKIAREWLDAFCRDVDEAIMSDLIARGLDAAEPLGIVVNNGSAETPRGLTVEDLERGRQLLDNALVPTSAGRLAIEVPIALGRVDPNFYRPMPPGAASLVVVYERVTSADEDPRRGHVYECQCGAWIVGDDGRRLEVLRRHAEQHRAELYLDDDLGDPHAWE